MKFNIFSEILVVYGITVRADCHRYNADILTRHWVEFHSVILCRSRCSLCLLTGCRAVPRCLRMLLAHWEGRSGGRGDERSRDSEKEGGGREGEIRREKERYTLNMKLSPCTTVCINTTCIFFAYLQWKLTSSLRHQHPRLPLPLLEESPWT